MARWLPIRKEENFFASFFII